MSNSYLDASGFQDQIIGHKFNELSLNSGEFLPLGEALNMLSADEKQNMMDNQFNEELPSDRFDKSTSSLPEGWKFASLCSVTPSSWQSGSDNSVNKEEVKKKKLSFGSYIALRSFPLGRLEGGEGVERPSFGHFQTQRNDRNSTNNISEVSSSEGSSVKGKLPSESDTQRNTTLGNEVNMMTVQHPSGNKSKHADFGLDGQVSKGFWNSHSSRFHLDSSESSYVGRQLSAITELSRESEQSSRVGSVAYHDFSICPPSHFIEQESDEIIQNALISYKAETSLMKENKIPWLSKQENYDALKPTYECLQTARRLGSKTNPDLVADWLKAATNHHVVDVNNNSPSRSKALGKMSFGKSSGSSNQCYSSTPIKSTACRLSSPVSDIEPCQTERIRLSSMSSCVFESPRKIEKFMNWDSESATICTSFSKKASKDSLCANATSSCVIQTTSELAFTDICCIGSSSEEKLKVDNISNLLCSINLSLHSLSINGEQVLVLDDHKHVFSFEQKIFLTKLSSNHIKIHFEPTVPGCYVAQLALKVTILDNKRNATQEKKNIEARKHVVTLQAIAEQPVVEITSLGLTSVCRKIDFGEIPGDCYDVKKMLVKNKCKANIPISINIASYFNGAKDCYKFLFHLSNALKTKVIHNQFSDCLLNMMLPPGCQIEMDVGFYGPRTTIGIKRVSCKIEILLASLKQTLLSSVDVHAVTAVPKIGISLKSMILTFNESMLEHKAKLSSKCQISLDLEIESESSSFAVQPKTVKLDPGQFVDLIVSYNHLPMKEMNGGQFKVESQVKFWIKPNGTPHIIRVVARTGSGAGSVTPLRSLSNYLPDDLAKLADQWQVSLKQCTFLVDGNESIAGMQNNSKTICIINNSDFDLSFKILGPETLSVAPSTCIIQARTSKGFKISPSPRVYSMIRENASFPELGVVSISCQAVVRHILVHIKSITSAKISDDKIESLHPLVILTCPPGQNSCTFQSQAKSWELFFKVSPFVDQSSATVLLASNCNKDIFWQLKPCNKKVISSNLKRSAPDDVFSFDSYQGMLHPGSSTELKVFLKIPFSASFYQVWIFDIHSDDRFKSSYFKLKAEVQIQIPYAKEQLLKHEIVEPAISEALTSLTDDSNSQEVKPHKFIDNAAIRLTSKDKKLQVTPEYLNFDSSFVDGEVIEKIEFKNKSNSDVEMKIIKLPQLPFVMEHKEFIVRGMCRLKIPVKYISNGGGMYQSEVTFMSTKGDKFTVHLVFKPSI